MGVKGKLSALLTVVSLLFAAVSYHYLPHENRLTDNTEGELAVYYLDVGQADSTIIISAGETMLIDAGEKGAASYIINSALRLGIKEFDYVVATHPHSDHIGGMPDVLKAIPAKQILMPDITHNTRIFENLIDTIDELNIELRIPNVGDTISLGEAEFTVLSPEIQDFDNMNNNSIVLKAVFGETAFLFMADAEQEVELRLVEKSYNLSADVIKVGHHGSKTSSVYEFLKEVSPEYAVISCGFENDYSHPHKEVMERLRSLRVQTFITYEKGDIAAKSDGKNISLSVGDIY